MQVWTKSNKIPAYCRKDTHIKQWSCGDVDRDNSNAINQKALKRIHTSVKVGHAMDLTGNSQLCDASHNALINTHDEALSRDYAWNLVSVYW